MADKGIMSGLILEGSRFEGKLTFKSMMQIHGEVEGEIISQSKLVVGKQARIKADIKVKELAVMGRVEGTITDCDLLEIQEGGQVFADVTVKTLHIKPGALFDGKCTMIKEPKNRK